MEHKSHHRILYIVIILFAAWLLYNTITLSRLNTSSWTCSNLVCSQVLTGDEWAKQNCYASPGPNNTQVMMCKVVINGNTQLVPELSLGNISSQSICLQYTCNQETNARPANYTFNVTKDQNKLYRSNTAPLPAATQ